MRNIVLLILFLCFGYSASAKSLSRLLEMKRDSNYIERYYNDLILRLYTVEKSHSLELVDFNTSNHLKYLPKGQYNFGVGANFRFFGIGLAAKLPFMQNGDEKHGKTSRLGLQTYLYCGKFSIDVLAYFMNGYYLKDSYEKLSSYTKYKEYQRPDMSSANIGVTLNYIFNNSKFSYKAAFDDTEKQKRNAGSLIAGGSFFSYQTKADSAIVPREIKESYFSKSRDITKSGVLAFNANIGYAYSFIFLRNGIFTMSYILGAGIEDNSFNLENKLNIDRWLFSFNQTGRIGLGYRFHRYYLRLGVIRSNQYSKLNYNDLGIINGTNFVQFSLGKRLSLKGKASKK